MSNELPPASDYASILKSSIHRETIARMVCSSCRQTNHLRIRRVLADVQLPPVLIVNAGVRTADELELWVDGRAGAGSRFLGNRFEIGKQGDAVVVQSQDGGESKGGVVYELRASRHFLVDQITPADLLESFLGYGGSNTSGRRFTSFSSTS